MYSVGSFIEMHFYQVCYNYYRQKDCLYTKVDRKKNKLPSIDLSNDWYNEKKLIIFKS